MNTLRQNLEIARALTIVSNAYPNAFINCSNTDTDNYLRPLNNGILSDYPTDDEIRAMFMLTPSLMKSLRESKKITQEEMAKRMMISREMYCRIENGSKQMSARLEFIAKTIFSKL